ncbi:hypothetical protein IAT38_003694 [Cryptococcus sp. DSM 104549]
MDFGSVSSMSGKSSMRRKSLLQALGKPRQSISSSTSPSSAPGSSPTQSQTSSNYTVPPAASTSHFPLDELHSPELDAMSMSSRSVSLGTHGTHSHSGYSGSHSSHAPSSFIAPGGGRSSSASLSTHSSSLSKDKRGEKERVVFGSREEAFALFLGRIKRWNFMRRWYQGEVLWCESVLIPRPYLEASLGPKHIETRARNFYMLGISLSALFDLTQANEFLKALSRLLDEWEAWTEGSSGGKGVKNLFRGPRSGRRATGGVSDFSPSGDLSESLLMVMNLPFTPDFYEVHSTLCSIILDIYRKLIGNLQPLPSSLSTSTSSSQSRSFHTPSGPSASASSPTYGNLHHPSVILRSVPLPNSTPTQSEAGNPRSPGASSLATATLSSQHGHSYAGYGLMSPQSQTLRPAAEDVDDEDPLKPYIMGERPADRVIVGDGQAMGDVAKLYSDVDQKLKKIIASLTREADAIAKRVVDDQLATLRRSLDPGGKAIRYDQTGGLGAVGSVGNAGPGYSTATLGRMMFVGGDEGGRDFGTI